MLIEVDASPQVDPLSPDDNDSTAHDDEVDGRSRSALLGVLRTLSGVQPLATLGPHAHQLTTNQTQRRVVGHAWESGVG